MEILTIFEALGVTQNYYKSKKLTKSDRFIAGARLRFVREWYFGPRTTNGGKPKPQPFKILGFHTWGELLANYVGIAPCTACNWINMANAVEILAERKGVQLNKISAKPPCDWSISEVWLVKAIVDKITRGKNLRQLCLSTHEVITTTQNNPEHTQTSKPVKQTLLQPKYQSNQHE